jgi:small subunit ribosomal protein S4
MGEKQFSKLVNETSKKYAKNKSLDHDKVLYQFLERRLDNVVLKSGFAKTIMQARQMVVHGHFTLNGRKHNVPSYFVQASDVITVRDRLQSSDLYSDVSANNPVWLSVDRA